MLSRSNKIPHFHRHFVLITLRRGPSLENIALSPPPLCAQFHPHAKHIIHTLLRETYIYVV